MTVFDPELARYEDLAELRDRYVQAIEASADNSGEYLLTTARFFINRAQDGIDDLSEDSAANVILAYGDVLHRRSLIGEVASTREVFNG